LETARVRIATGPDELELSVETFLIYADIVGLAGGLAPSSLDEGIFG
jgi:hypothetical protein